HARRADLRPAPAGQAAPGAPAGAVHARPLRARRGDPARLRRPRDDVRAAALLRAAGGDRAQVTIRADGGRRARCGRRERPRRGLMAPHVAGLTGATLETAPSVCHDCVWWQSRGRRVDKRRWIARAEEEWGAWGTVYYDGGRLLGSMQYGPAGLFPRAAELPAGPPSP